MKNVICVFSIVALAFGCSYNQEPVAIDNSASIQLGDSLYQLKQRLISNENCNTLYIIADYSSDFPYVLNMVISTMGNIINMSIADRNNSYRSLPFNPSETITITQFEYDSVASTVSMVFMGRLFSNNRSVSIPIRGNINKLKVKSTNCSSMPANLQAELEKPSGEKEKFYSISGISEFDSRLYRQYYYSNNGYRLVIESKVNFKNFSPGSYFFKSGIESEILVTFQKYVGSQQINISNTFNPDEWLNYSTEGVIELEQPTVLNNMNGIKGLINMTIFDSNTVIYQLKKGNMLIANVSL